LGVSLLKPKPAELSLRFLWRRPHAAPGSCPGKSSMLLGEILGVTLKDRPKPFERVRKTDFLED